MKYKELTHWKRLWCWEGLGAGGEGDDRGWDGWMASLTGWTWVWVNSWSWWWTGRPVELQFMRSQRVGHNWATDLIWSDLTDSKNYLICDSISVRYPEKANLWRQSEGLRFSEAEGWGHEVTMTNDTGRCFERMEMFCSWTDVLVAQLSTVTKKRRAGHLKQVNTMLCKLYLSKDISVLFLFMWLCWV